MLDLRHPRSNIRCVDKLPLLPMANIATMKQLLNPLQFVKHVVLLFCLFVFSTGVQADDTELFNLRGCDAGEQYRFVFIVDNSGSMSTTEFNQSKATIDAVITEVLDSSLSGIEVAVLQYGSSNSGDHTYNVAVPFTGDLPTALNWNRAYGTGGNLQPTYYQDHQPASLAELRRDNAYGPGGVLDVSDATNVQFVFFTDAARDYGGGCCTSIVADNRRYIGTHVRSGFGEYDLLKNGSVLPGGLKAQFTPVTRSADSGGQTCRSRYCFCWWKLYRGS